MITLDAAKEALLRSGYLLESRIESLLRRHGYYVDTNPVLPDPHTPSKMTSKMRELDVYALKAISAGPGDRDFLFTALLIECINNPEPLVLITKDPLIGFLHHQDLKLSGLPLKFPAKGGLQGSIPFTEYLGLEKYHHYCMGRVATQYCSFQKKKQPPNDWMASHDEAHFDAFQKLPVAVEHDVAEGFRKWRFRGKGPMPVNLQIYYPVLVVQGELLEAKPSRSGLHLAHRGHIAFRRIGLTDERNYQIDVVQEKHFTRFVTLVDRESSRMARLLRRRHREVRRAVESIVRRARRFKSDEQIRAAMEA